ncbi:hypothetical protein LCGC14_1064480 [marine sediment metagenome]|uniref:Uncharacterized protein n=1 Tax=marine sediment metagenome TaxID=412755 RepID=A0A0F9MJY8_9ZZZZ
MDNFNPLFNETFIFRPFDGAEGRGIVATTNRSAHAGQGLLRYAGGQWIPDDGEYDLAFAHGVFAYGVLLPDYSNIIWSWRNMVLVRSWLPERLHKYAKAHHFYNINNTPFSQDYHWDNSHHPNKVAMKSAMDKVCSLCGCANGRGAYLTSEQDVFVQWLAEKRIMIKSTMQPVLIPENPTCYLCLDNGKGHLIEALQNYKEQLESDIEYAEEAKSKAELAMYDSEDIIDTAKGRLPEVIEELQELGNRVSPSLNK